MLKKQIITTEEFYSTGELSRRIVEENEFIEDTPLQMPYQMPYEPGDTKLDEQWWREATCTTTSPVQMGTTSTITVSHNSMEDQDGKN